MGPVSELLQKREGPWGQSEVKPAAENVMEGTNGLPA